LFRLADDSLSVIAGYIDLGDIFVATRSGVPLGHAQLVAGDSPGEIELKNLAVGETFQRTGIGTALMAAAVRHSRKLGAVRLTVSTSIAASDAIAFYLRRGFRICGYARDVFTPEAGYPLTEGDTGLPLNDAVLFELILAP